DHGGHVYSIDLKPERQLPQFRPGQFLHLAIDPYEPGDFWPESRVFSIASNPADRNILSLTYSVVGSFTKRMEQTLKVGSVVWVKLPYGDFVIDKTGEVVLIAGGTGITAFTAFLDGTTSKDDQKVTLFYGARNRDLLIFSPLVERKLNEVEKFSVWYFIEEGQTNEESHTINGRISAEIILQKNSLANNPVFFLSGPPAMLQTLTSDLLGHGISADSIKTDAWE
ncbi:FAD-dependent oxidoreductase, partial [bacterium]|nr:FAD-dependent oxidoreductase [bacterium]